MFWWEFEFFHYNIKWYGKICYIYFPNSAHCVSKCFNVSQGELKLSKVRLFSTISHVSRFTALHLNRRSLFFDKHVNASFLPLCPLLSFCLGCHPRVNQPLLPLLQPIRPAATSLSCARHQLSKLAIKAAPVVTSTVDSITHYKLNKSNIIKAYHKIVMWSATWNTKFA